MKNLKIILILSILFISFFGYYSTVLAKLSLNSTTILYLLSTISPFNRQITLKKIFKNDHSWITKLSREKVVVVNATGDVVIARSVNYKTVTEGKYKWLFKNVSDVLNKADMTLINLESPLIKNCPLTKEKIATFCGGEKNIEGLKSASVNAVNLANNHIYDYGLPGVNNTINLLKNANILYTGTTNPTFKKVKNVRFAFLGFNDIDKKKATVPLAYETHIKSEITEAKKKADVVIVSFHWGVQYTAQPTLRQKNLAHLAVDSGADIIIGNHPHWIQPVEVYKNRVIIYSQGNFIFDQLWSEKTRVGIISRFYFYNKKLIDVELLPIKIGNFGQPRLLNGIERKKILTTLEKSTKQ